jgi:hypothetical protein
MEHNWELHTEVITLEQFMDEVDETMEDIKECYGGQTKGFVRAVLQDNTNGYYMRLFAGVYASTFLAYAQATNTVTLELLQDYFEYCKGLENK